MLVAGTNNVPRNEQKEERKGRMIDWWVGTVVLAFFPILVSVVTSLVRFTYVDLERMVGDGELILSSFLVTTPSLISHFNNKKASRLIYYLLLFTAFFQLIAYTSIKTNPSNLLGVVLITSFFCMVSSIVIAWKGELILQGGQQ